MRDNNPGVKGLNVDKRTRCRHYHSEVDIIAIKFHCCKEYYACYYCHKETADHPVARWPQQAWNKQAILCGNCLKELTISEYMATSSCPKCKSPFNKNCSYHHHLYFEL